MIRMMANGVLTVVAMAKPESGHVHISLVNNTGTSLDELSLLPGTTQAAWFFRNLPNQAFTEFADLVSGRYGGVWKLGEKQEFVRGSDNASLGLVNLQADSWYCLIIATTSSDTKQLVGHTGVIWDISPPNVAAN